MTLVEFMGTPCEGDRFATTASSTWFDRAVSLHRNTYFPGKSTYEADALRQGCSELEVKRNYIRKLFQDINTIQQDAYGRNRKCGYHPLTKAHMPEIMHKRRHERKYIRKQIANLHKMCDI